MVGAQTTLNNQLNAAAAMVTEMATMTVMTTRMKTKVTAAGVAAWQQRDGGSGGSAVLALVAALQWQQQCGCGGGGSLARTTAMMAR